MSTTAENVDRLVREWAIYDDRPPVELLAFIGEKFDVELAIRSIIDIGRAGRLRAYVPYLERFITLRAQSRRILQETR